MGKSLLMLIALVVAAGLAYFGYTAYKNQKLVNEVYNPPQDGPTYTVTLDEQNGSKESGVASFVEKNGKVVVTLSLSNAPTDVDQPAHIHVGSCPNPGAIKFPLIDVAVGSSETQIDTTIEELKAMGPLAVNVHESAANTQNYVACGDLKL